MFFKKSFLIASLTYNEKNSFLVYYSKDTKGLKFMSQVELVNLELLDGLTLGERCLNALIKFKTKAKAPENLSKQTKPLFEKMGCKNWNTLVEKYQSIGLEGVKGKYLLIQPSYRDKQGVQRFYATNQDEIEKIEWDAKVLGNRLLEIMQQTLMHSSSG